MNVDYAVFLNVFPYNHMASAMRSTLSEFCFCGCHWTSSNTACDNTGVTRTVGQSSWKFQLLVTTPSQCHKGCVRVLWTASQG